MTKVATKHPSLNVSCKFPSYLEPARRLIVLVPYLDADLPDMMKRLWKLAEATGAHIKFLCLCNDPTPEPSLRRGPATISATVNYDKVSAETEVIVGRDWVEAVKSRCQPGDIVVCFDEQRVGLLQRPLSQILQADLDVPVYILSGFYPQDNSRVNWLAQAALWIGFIAIVLGFFILQINIYHLAKDWTTIVELISTALEFWLIWVWNNLFASHWETTIKPKSII